MLVLFISIAAIGADLSDGVRLHYASGASAQAPWVYDSVRATPRPEFDRCVTVYRREQPPRESCARADSLFERTAAGAYRLTRPIGAGMSITIAGAAGTTLHYTTGDACAREVPGGGRIACVTTTLVTRDSTGRALRRLREQYAPGLLTALGGTFEEPDDAGGWRTVREFTLTEIRK